MRYVLTREEMQKVDAFTIEQIGIPGIVLMERAALAMKEEICHRIPTGQRILIVTEKGNNGGDGLALGRLLLDERYDVDIMEIGEISRASDSYQIQRNILESLAIPILTDMPEREYDVYIDAIFGVGLTRDIEGRHAQIIQELNHRKGYRIALDMPSGVDAATGHILGVGFQADLTITVGYEKIGLLLYPGASYAKEVVVKDIGFPEMARKAIGSTGMIYEKKDLCRLPQRKPWSNKGTYGKVLLIAGSVGMAGAAVLGARAAYRSGCGLVKVFTPERNREILHNQVPEAIITTWSEDPDETNWNLETLSAAIDWASVIGIGPGVGLSSMSRRFLMRILQTAHKPLVIDADGLNLLSELMKNDRGRQLFSEYDGGMILTPHLMEMSRLSRLTVPQIQDDLTGTARIYADREHVVVLKDARTIVTDGTQPVYINVSGNHGMAVAGSGDVLTGIICGFLAGNLTIAEAARLGVYCHGLAGDAAAEEKGYYSLMAGDIIESLPKVLGKPDGRSVHCE